MQRGRVFAAALTACVFAPATSMGQVTWQTIHAAGDPRITLDIPAGVDQETSIDAKKGQLMAFFATAGDEDLDCFLLRSPYSKKVPQKRFSVALHKSMSGYCWSRARTSAAGARS